MAAPSKRPSKAILGLILTPAAGIAGYFGYSFLNKRYQQPKQYQFMEQKKKQLKAISSNLHYLKGKKQDVYLYGADQINPENLSEIQKSLHALQHEDDPAIYRHLAKLRMQSHYLDTVSMLRNTLLNEPEKLYKQPVANLTFDESLILLLNDEVETRRILIL
eukprot:CAMPEP_0115018298 /NCGR_PEP_ID=MMETSP0216-20121206/28711_1 /TAXON_ID=223996 /ORGANISM="Protocruzia adherens, Strain Boccale" /LENGTH=161 /DNA_ID=CAMNT_0002389443 /DNA_START=31 /DNA_END=513 /DNA_ORIENTATION=-